jgi:hypothetical protein
MPLTTGLPDLMQPCNDMAIPLSSINDVSAASTRAVHVVRDVGELEGLKAEWKALFEISPTASPPLRWEWIREWWRIFGPVYPEPGHGLLAAAHATPC